MAKEDLFSSNEFDGLLPATTGFAEGPERELLRALLFDGIQSYFSFQLNTSPAVKERYKEAYHWIHARDSDYVFSFQSVCEGLGLDADALRLGIANFVNSNQVEIDEISMDDSQEPSRPVAQSNWRKAKRRQL